MGKFLMIVLLVLWLVQPSFGGSYFVFQEWGGTWQDADKTFSNQDDSLMCWAAAAANVLKWGHWDTANCDTAASIFAIFHDHWTNGTGSPVVAWQWWFNGRPTVHSESGLPAGHGRNDDPSYDYGKWGAHLKGSDKAGDYWASFDFHRYFHEELDTSKAMDAINAFLHKGCGVVAGVERRGSPWDTC